MQQAPSRLIARLRCRPAADGGRVASSLVQCPTMPVWLRVKETKTPMMYSWISRVVLASNASTRAPARTASTTMPLENTSRSPRR